MTRIRLTIHKFDCSTIPSGVPVETLELPMDDYKFHALLKHGPVRSLPKGPLTVSVIDGATLDGKAFVLPMTLLDASIIADSHEDFYEHGLLAAWKLSCRPDGSFSIKLLEPYSGTKTPAAIHAFLLDPASAHFVRQRYTLVLRGDDVACGDVVQDKTAVEL